MFSSLRGSKVFLVSLILCVSLSAIIYLSVYVLVKVRPSTQLISPAQTVLFVLAMGAVVGLFKSLIVSGISFLVKPSLRSWLILGSTVALSILDTWIYYELLIMPFPDIG